MRRLAPGLLVTAKTQRSKPEEFDVAASSIPSATFDYLASLEWIRASENVCLIGPAGSEAQKDPFPHSGHAAPPSGRSDSASALLGRQVDGPVERPRS